MIRLSCICKLIYLLIQKEKEFERVKILQLAKLLNKKNLNGKMSNNITIPCKIILSKSICCYHALPSRKVVFTVIDQRDCIFKICG